MAKRTTQFTVKEPLQPCVGSQFSIKGIKDAKTFFISHRILKCWCRNDAWLIKTQDELQSKECYSKNQGSTHGIVRWYHETLEVRLWNCFSVARLESLGTTKDKTSTKCPEGTEYKRIEQPNCLASTPSSQLTPRNEKSPGMEYSPNGFYGQVLKSRKCGNTFLATNW